MIERKKTALDFANKTLKEFNSFTTKEKKQIIRTLNSAANKKLVRQGKTGQFYMTKEKKPSAETLENLFIRVSEFYKGYATKTPRTKAPTRRINVKKYYNEITQEKFNSMTNEELKRELTDLTRIANNRLKALAKEGTSPAYQKYIKSNPKGFHVFDDLNRNKMEFANVKGFLESQTSTQAGLKKWVNNVNKALNERLGQTLTDIERDKFWEEYNKFIELNPNIRDDKGSYGSAKYQEELYKLMKNGKSGTDLYNDLINRIATLQNQEYSKRQQLRKTNMRRLPKH